MSENIQESLEFLLGELKTEIKVVGRKLNSLSRRITKLERGLSKTNIKVERIKLTGKQKAVAGAGIVGSSSIATILLDIIKGAMQ